MHRQRRCLGTRARGRNSCSRGREWVGWREFSVQLTEQDCFLGVHKAPSNHLIHFIGGGQRGGTQRKYSINGITKANRVAGRPQRCAVNAYHCHSGVGLIIRLQTRFNVVQSDVGRSIKVSGCRDGGRSYCVNDSKQSCRYSSPIDWWTGG